MSAQRRRYWLTVAVLVLFGLAAFLGGAATDRYLARAGSERPGGFAEQAPLLEEAWAAIERDYVFKRETDPRALAHGAIRGLVEALGDEGHTRFLTPEELRREEEQLSGTFSGIGAEVSQRDGRIVVVAPLEGSPAERAGLRAGDIILRVDDEETARLTLDAAINRIRGPKGTPVRLSILRAGNDAILEVTIIRAEIAVRSVSWTLVPGTRIAHVAIAQFSENLSAELRAALRQARERGAAGVVLDLRDNPGGLLEQAVGVGSEFLSAGDVLLEEDADGRRRPFPVRPGGSATDLPLAVLVNRGTASAAEIVAGAVQDHRRGLVIGERTFGAGTVLSTVRLSDGSAILLGTAQWLTPAGRAVRGQGIQPDVEVALPADQPRLSPRVAGGLSPAEIAASPDAQLREALRRLGWVEPAAGRPAPAGGL